MRFSLFALVSLIALAACDAPTNTAEPDRPMTATANSVQSWVPGENTYQHLLDTRPEGYNVTERKLIAQSILIDSSILKIEIARSAGSRSPDSDVTNLIGILANCKSTAEDIKSNPGSSQEVVKWGVLALCYEDVVERSVKMASPSTRLANYPEIRRTIREDLMPQTRP